jgi:hypothetical protein
VQILVKLKSTLFLHTTPRGLYSFHDFRIHVSIRVCAYYQDMCIRYQKCSAATVSVPHGYYKPEILAGKLSEVECKYD